MLTCETVWILGFIASLGAIKIFTTAIDNLFVDGAVNFEPNIYGSYIVIQTSKDYNVLKITYLSPRWGWYGRNSRQHSYNGVTLDSRYVGKRSVLMFIYKSNFRFYDYHNTLRTTTGFQVLNPDNLFYICTLMILFFQIFNDKHNDKIYWL